MREDLLQAIQDAKRAVELVGEEECISFITAVEEELWRCFEKSGKAMIAGNGGSLCDAMHFAEELTGFFRSKRRPLAAIVLSDPGHMSCVSNDVGFEHVFSRMIESLGKEEDLFIAMTTSGNSKNLVLAAEAAKAKGMKVIGFLGKGGGDHQTFMRFFLDC